MVDPKRVEFAPYDGIPHLYVPVVTECARGRQRPFLGRGRDGAAPEGVLEVRRAQHHHLQREGPSGPGGQRGWPKRAEEPPENLYGEPIPYIVIVIDELADLMMNVGKEVEFSISRIAQLARAAGIHLIIATQRPSTNVVTGLIKANITCRIGLTVASGIDSRVILDSHGRREPHRHGGHAPGQAGVPQAHPHPGPATSPTTRSPPWWRT